MVDFLTVTQPRGVSNALLSLFGFKSINWAGEQMLTDATPHYAAFISYAHADEAVAARLHKALETYPVPKHLRGEGRTTRPIFRDVAELTAAHSLSEKIRDAVNNSRVLIVLCSPAAKASHWVNEEIKLFREIHGDGAILSALIEGTPATSFPEALIQGGREPLAASLGASNAGFKLGVTQLAAGILGTGLDELVQRGARRRTRRMGIGLAASLAFSAVMGFTAYQAVDARNEAELERGESEALLGYMIKDLKVKLEPVGRLELLEGVGRKAIEYYDNKKIDELSDDSLRILAAARQVVAEVALDAGQMMEAQSQIEASSDLTREVLARNPDDTDAIYAHAQSEYYVGAYYRKQNKIAETEKPYREYDRLAQQLYQKDPTNFDWVMEAGWGQNNLGIWARESLESDLVDDAIKYYDKAIELFELALDINPESMSATYELANSYSGRSFSELPVGMAISAREFQEEQLKLFDELEQEYPKSIPVAIRKLKAVMDHYDGFYLMHSEDQKSEIRTAIDNFFELAKYDSKNFDNMESFLNSATNNFESLGVEDLKSRQLKIIEILKLYRKGGQDNIQLYELMLGAIDVKIDILDGQNQLAMNKLTEINVAASSFGFSKKNSTNLFFTLFLRNQELGNNEAAISYANEFLNSSDMLVADLKYPTMSEKKIVVFSALGICKKIEPLATDLVTRGFRTENWKNSLSCSQR
ncbi:MAG: toll/interleukin-1 receptor domain-containing protein [Hellea sp.]